MENHDLKCPKCGGTDLTRWLPYDDTEPVAYECRECSLNREVDGVVILKNLFYPQN
jgi:hypothetical protein